MISDDDKRFHELNCKQSIYQKRKNVVDKKPERVYYRDRFEKNSENIEAKYEEQLKAIEIDRKLVEKWEKQTFLIK